MTTETLLVEGMTCAHCVMSVTEELTELDGVSGVDVRLVVGGSSEVTVTSAAPVDTDALRAAVAEAGYEVVPS
ncbi:heavy-metal-associated domain-containing protein [Curtobacterium sp. VKM Ac-1376]|uniref:heavy-metal-associated domain-containing protein n=1 Tax=Curtobacterium sp. VKM Ac-1376 TaxID=123312 RepID=UPI00188B61F1|nr:cation transporter [Curtobacterium sp. VKM Ac-1376]MBF4613141.1 heavy-metal-associated domain-containing protein [Curtobacterium sp. VKM Ac-1376]